MKQFLPRAIEATAFILSTAMFCYLVAACAAVL